MISSLKNLWRAAASNLTDQSSMSLIETKENSIEEVLMPASYIGKVVSDVFSHEVKNKGKEVGGILTAVQCGEVFIITGVYRAKKILANRVGFIIPSDEITRIDEQRRRDEQSRIGGMYHLHPGFGVFMSSVDVEATERFSRFFGPSINLVISTKENQFEYKFYTVEDGRAKELKHRFTLG